MITRGDLIAICGDTHLGIKRLNDFNLDARLVKFLTDLLIKMEMIYGQRTLVLLGDIFDLYQTLYYFSNQSKVVPMEILQAIASAHPEVIKLLNEFSHKYDVYWVIGNHDGLLKQNSYKRALHQLLPRVQLTDKFSTVYKYQDKSVRLTATHGNQYDPIEKDGWGIALLELILNILEEFFPEIDNISPASLAAFLEDRLKKIFERQTGKIPSTAINPLTIVNAALNGNTKDKVALAIQLLHYYRNAVIKSGEKFVSEAKKLATGSRKYPEEISIAVLGHKHTAVHHVFDEKTLYINSGCWVPEVAWDETSKTFIQKQRSDVVMLGSDLNPFDKQSTLLIA